MIVSAANKDDVRTWKGRRVEALTVMVELFNSIEKDQNDNEC